MDMWFHSGVLTKLEDGGYLTPDMVKGLMNGTNGAKRIPNDHCHDEGDIQFKFPVTADYHKYKSMGSWPAAKLFLSTLG